MRNMISRLSLSQNSIQTTLETPPPPPKTISGHHEPLLLAAEPPHREEFFNHSGILRIHLKDSMEKNPSILFFLASLRLFWLLRLSLS